MRHNIKSMAKKVSADTGFLYQDVEKVLKSLVNLMDTGICAGDEFDFKIFEIYIQNNKDKKYHNVITGEWTVCPSTYTARIRFKERFKRRFKEACRIKKKHSEIPEDVFEKTVTDYSGNILQLEDKESDERDL